MTQEKAISMSLEGHSFVMTGSCGTGKTYTLKEIIKKVSVSKNVAVTATTGMASLQLEMEATTLHHWCGIADGRYGLDKLAELFDNDDKYASAKQRILSTDCLIIDEISMLSSKMFEMAEFVCRHVKNNSLCFGGMQVIGSGDFKQLPPVPNRFVNDDGNYCFCSPTFDVVFPHHLHLSKVIRQNEADLVTAVQELCDGSPSENTIQLLRSLNVPLDVPDDQLTRLYGTNFDVRYVNEQMLENLEGDIHIFKAKDEGNRQLLLRSPAPKTLLLKEGAPVIVIKNLGGNLFNGQRGYVHRLVHGSAPIINVNGKLHRIDTVQFEIFDTNQQKVVASRTQIPVILSYAMTVHRAQGQTIKNVEVDCSSFFAPGQLGVAIGRAVCKSGLRVQNLSISAANLKHPDTVYNFYRKQFLPTQADLSCCTRISLDISLSAASPKDKITSSSDSETNEDIIMEDLPRSECPYDIDNFIKDNSQAKFVSILTTELTSSLQFKNHVQYIHYRIESCLKKNPTKTSQFVEAYKELNAFLIEDEHINAIKSLFKVRHVTKEQNKFSSKLAFWIMDQKIQEKSKQVLSVQPESTSSTSAAQTPLSEPGSAKLRYIAGVCVHKIRNRLRESVERNIGKVNKSSKLTKTMSYKKEKMLKTLSVSEDSVDSNDPSLSEIQAKQYKSRGLTIVSDRVFEFFKSLNSSMQSVLSNKSLHLNIDNIHQVCRSKIDSSRLLLSDWISLFACEDSGEFEDEIILVLISELFVSVTEHFLKLSIVDSMKSFKRSIPRKKKQALRTKIQALGERDSKKKKTQKASEGDDVYICTVCDTVCEEQPEDESGESIGCDKCNNWFHYGCVNITGNEPFLKSSASTWFCSSCKRGKGKGRGKKTKK